jgi:sec-independent protein translocase protein TatA
MFGSLGLPELLIILVIVILIFGANRLPGLARGMGSAVKNFKEGMKDDTTDHKS